MSKKKRIKPERELVQDLFTSYYHLTLIGWLDPVYAPKYVDLEVIELGSTGIHKATRDDFGFWVHDNIDTYPSKPILFRIITTPGQ